MDVSRDVPREQNDAARKARKNAGEEAFKVGRKGAVALIQNDVFEFRQLFGRDLCGDGLIKIFDQTRLGKPLTIEAQIEIFAPLQEAIQQGVLGQVVGMGNDDANPGLEFRELLLDKVLY